MFHKSTTTIKFYCSLLLKLIPTLSCSVPALNCEPPPATSPSTRSASCIRPCQTIYLSWFRVNSVCARQRKLLPTKVNHTESWNHQAQVPSERKCLAENVNHSFLPRGSTRNGTGLGNQHRTKPPTKCQPGPADFPPSPAGVLGKEHTKWNQH